LTRLALPSPDLIPSPFLAFATAAARQLLTGFHQTPLVRLFVRVAERRAADVTEFQSKSHASRGKTIDDRVYIVFS